MESLQEGQLEDREIQLRLAVSGRENRGLLLRAEIVESAGVGVSGRHPGDQLSDRGLGDHARVADALERRPREGAVPAEALRELSDRQLVGHLGVGRPSVHEVLLAHRLALTNDEHPILGRLDQSEVEVPTLQVLGRGLRAGESPEFVRLGIGMLGDGQLLVSGHDLPFGRGGREFQDFAGILELASEFEPEGVHALEDDARHGFCLKNHGGAVVLAQCELLVRHYTVGDVAVDLLRDHVVRLGLGRRIEAGVLGHDHDLAIWAVGVVAIPVPVGPEFQSLQDVVADPQPFPVTISVPDVDGDGVPGDPGLLLPPDVDFLLAEEDVAPDLPARGRLEPGDDRVGISLAAIAQVDDGDDLLVPTTPLALPEHEIEGLDPLRVEVISQDLTEDGLRVDPTVLTHDVPPWG